MYLSKKFILAILLPTIFSTSSFGIKPSKEFEDTVIGNHLKISMGASYKEDISLSENIKSSPFYDIINDVIPDKDKLKYEQIIQQINFIHGQIEKMAEIEKDMHKDAAALYFGCDSEAALLFDIIQNLNPHNPLPFRFPNQNSEITRDLQTGEKFYNYIFEDLQKNDSSEIFRQIAICASVSPLQMRLKESAGYFWVGNSKASPLQIEKILCQNLKLDPAKVGPLLTPLLVELTELSSQRSGMMYQMVFKDNELLSDYGWVAKDFGYKKERNAGLIGDFPFLGCSLRESLKFLKADMRRQVAFTECESKKVNLSTYILNDAQDLDNFQTRLYLHPNLQDPEKIELHSYSSYPVDEKWKDQYQGKINSFCKFLKSLQPS